jgi:hypothetical protein
MVFPPKTRVCQMMAYLANDFLNKELVMIAVRAGVIVICVQCRGQILTGHRFKYVCVSVKKYVT